MSGIKNNKEIFCEKKEPVLYSSVGVFNNPFFICYEKWPYSGMEYLGFTGTLQLSTYIGISFFIYDCLRKSKYYSSLLKRLDELDKKYFIGDVATEEDFLEGKILFEIISQATKSMKDDISESIRNSNDYKE